MSHAFHRRLLKLESRSIGAFEGEAWINRCLEDPAYLVEFIRANPARPGSQAAAIQSGLLELAPSLPFPVPGQVPA